MNAIPHKPPPSINVLRMLVLALLLGMSSAAGVFVVLRTTGQTTPAAPLPADTLTLILGAVALGAAFLILLLPPLIVKQSRARFAAAVDDDERDIVMRQVLTTTTLIRSAMAEGVGLFGAVIFLLTGEWAVLAAPALAAVAILSFYPTAGKIRRLHESLTRTT